MLNNRPPFGERENMQTEDSQLIMNNSRKQQQQQSRYQANQASIDNPNAFRAAIFKNKYLLFAIVVLLGLLIEISYLQTLAHDQIQQSDLRNKNPFHQKRQNRYRKNNKFYQKSSGEVKQNLKNPSDDPFYFSKKQNRQKYQEMHQKLKQKQKSLSENYKFQPTFNQLHNKKQQKDSTQNQNQKPKEAQLKNNDNSISTQSNNIINKP